MNKLKFAAAVLVSQLLMFSQAFAQACSETDPSCVPGQGAVPEIDGSGAIIAIGLVAGLVALIREKYFRR